MRASAVWNPTLAPPLVLRDVEGMSNCEAADILDITVSALKLRLHRARVLVRKYLEEYVNTPKQ